MTFADRLTDWLGRVEPVNTGDLLCRVQYLDPLATVDLYPFEGIAVVVFSDESRYFGLAASALDDEETRH